MGLVRCVMIGLSFEFCSYDELWWVMMSYDGYDVYVVMISLVFCLV